MSYDPITRGMAVSEKLRSAARNNGDDTRVVQMRFAQERLLARLQAGKYKDRFLLKGGLMFSCKSTSSSRPTDDIDLHDPTGLGLQNIAKAIHESAGTMLEDGIVFDMSSFKVAQIREAGSPGVRVTMAARIGRSQVSVKLDLCTGDPVTPAAVIRTLPSSLPKDFEGVPFKSYPWETALAEKMHAVSKFGHQSTRMKDWYDIATIAQEEELDAGDLCHAIERTFAWRNDTRIDPFPEGFDDEFIEAKSYDYSRHVKFFEPPESRDTLEKAVYSCRELLLPVLAAVAEGERIEGTWHPGSGWDLARELQIGR